MGWSFRLHLDGDRVLRLAHLNILEVFTINPFILKAMSSALLADRYRCSRTYCCSMFTSRVCVMCPKLKEMLFLFLATHQMFSVHLPKHRDTRICSAKLRERGRVRLPDCCKKYIDVLGHAHCNRFTLSPTYVYSKCGVGWDIMMFFRYLLKAAETVMQT